MLLRELSFLPCLKARGFQKGTVYELTSGEPITLLLGGQEEIKGHIEHSGSDCRPGCYQIADWGKEGTSRQPADPLAASIQQPHDLYRGYSFIAEDGTVSGLCTAWKYGFHR